MERLNQIENHDGFASEQFFDQNSLQQIQQIDATAGLGSVGNIAPNPAVVEQVQRRWYSGCLERIAWSRNGHIASISDDASTVYLECLRCNYETKSWELHTRHALTTVFEDATSLAWSSTGAELAVVDVKGRLWIFHHSLSTINRLVLARQGSLDPVTDTSQPIGMAWLNQDRQDRPKNVVIHASKSDTRWIHQNARAKSLGPCWHRAVVLVHRGGLLTLCFQRGDGQYSKVTKQLSTSEDDLYSHAGLAPTGGGKLLVALHSFDAIISVYFVSIDWSEVRQAVEGLPVLTVD